MGSNHLDKAAPDRLTEVQSHPSGPKADNLSPTTASPPSSGNLLEARAPETPEPLK